MTHEQPDSLTKGIRFGCGFVAGMVLAVGSALPFLYLRGEILLAGIVVVGLVFGSAAMRYGERFWDWLTKMQRSWWW